MTRWQCAAHGDENHRLHGGNAGDQTGHEVSVSKYSQYRHGWDGVLRYDGKFKKRVRNRMIKAAVQIANSNVCGYDQYERLTLRQQMVGFNWLLRKIKKLKKCECDCSSFIGVVVSIAQVPLNRLDYTPVPADNWTGNEKTYLKARGFVWVTGIDFETGKGLKPGDVLLCEQHHTSLYIGTNKDGSLYK